jgi:hypothetical protein
MRASASRLRMGAILAAVAVAVTGLTGLGLTAGPDGRTPAVAEVRDPPPKGPVGLL